MAIVDRTTLKSYFEPPHVPIQSNYIDFIDTMGTFPPVAHAHTALDIDGGNPVFTSVGASGDANITGSIFGGHSSFRVIDHTDHSHLVINPSTGWALDEQFGVDIDDNLLVRGFIVGRHAIQLKGVKLMVHFDGPVPYETNFDCNITAHLGQVPVMGTVPVGRPSIWGKGLLTGASQKNFVWQPSMENGWDNWGQWAGNPSTIVLSNWAWVGIHSIKVTTAGSSQFSGVRSSGVSFEHYSTKHSYSFWVYYNQAPYQLTYRIQAADYSQLAYGHIEAKPGWQMCYGEFTTPASGTMGVRIAIGAGGTADPVQVFYVDGVLITEGPLTPFFDGDFASDYSWEGTAGSSISVRPNSYLKYDKSNVDTKKGTVIWRGVAGHAYNDGFHHGPFNIGSSAYDVPYSLQAFKFYSNDTFYLRMRDAVSYKQITWLVPYMPGDELFIAATWDEGNSEFSAYIYLNGVKQLAASRSDLANMGTVWSDDIYVGYGYGNAWGGTTDEFVILDHSISAAEIDAIALSDSPVFAETSTWQWRAGKNLLWADDEGLWMFDVDGGAVIGISGVDNKTWGGTTMMKGDILFGKSGSAGGGWLYWNRDGATNGLLELGYADKIVWRFDVGGATLDGVLDISNNGGIYQGSGSFSSPSTGLKIWADSGIGKIGGFNSGNPQWSVNTDGRFYAGGTTVKLDADGIDVKIAGAYALLNSYSLSIGTTSIGGLGGFYDSTIRSVILKTEVDAGDPMVDLMARSYNGTTANVILTATPNYNTYGASVLRVLRTSSENGVRISGGLMVGSDFNTIPPVGVLEATSLIRSPMFGSSNNVTLNDDAAMSIIAPSNAGMFVIFMTGGCELGGSMVAYRCNTVFTRGVLLNSSTDITTGVLTGTTGTDGRFTISAHTDGKIYLENRRGSTASFAYIFIGGTY